MSHNPQNSLDVFNLEDSRPPDSLFELTANRIRTMIKTGKLAPGTQLPNEIELAGAMKVSRGTIRAALGLLQQQGLIWRRQGIGSFVSEIPILENRLDINMGVTNLVYAMGRTPGTKKLKVKEITADENQSQLLNLSVGDPLVFVNRIRTADQKVVIASIDLFTKAILNKSSPPVSLEELRQYLSKEHSLYKVLETRFNMTVDYGIAHLRPMKINSAGLKQVGFDIAVESVVLYLEQIDYDRNRDPIILSMEYHLAEFCDFTVYRCR
ncbi:MAG: GntR family transcriptional regulator [Anaerolineales bacterium]|nr:GntR family transcriptional regulator [Anaerolineales bacterium]